MKQISQSTGGAANVRPKASADAPADKWRILDLLTGCAESFGIGHRELNVLRALLSFLPERIIAAGTAVVFPSNATLSDRLNGLPESTLRRHLARLVASGLVGRCDSPNRKRYARRNRSGGLLRAFGFDLAPLATAATAIEAAAERAEAARAEIAVLRENLALLRSDLLTAAAEDHDLAEAARRMLRRHASPQDLRALAEKL
ncbi:replication initiator RepC, partial [Amaricoccus sp. HAR-UPW-R2A-40]